MRLSVDGEGRRLELSRNGSTIVGAREPVRIQDVGIDTDGARLAATVSIPRASGPVPGIVLIHGSGPRVRADSSLLAQILLSLGYAVLQFDKRGVGGSTGTYPGEGATEENLRTYAADAAAAIAYLAARPEIDGRAVGLMGGSQAGWIIPIAATESPALAFGVALVGPTVTVGEQDWYGNLSGDGSHAPTLSDDEIRAQLAGHAGGFDPLPILRRVEQPILWLYGSADRIVPTERSVAILDGLRKEGRSNYEIVVLQDGDHGLLENPSGIEAGAALSTRLADGFRQKLGHWLSSVAPIRGESVALPAGRLGTGRYEAAPSLPRFTFEIQDQDAGLWQSTGPSATGFALIADHGAIGVLDLTASSLGADATAEAILAGLGASADKASPSMIAGRQAVVIDPPSRSSARSFDLGPNPLTFSAGERNRIIVIDSSPGPVIILFGAPEGDFAGLVPAFERWLSTVEL